MRRPIINRAQLAHPRLGACRMTVLVTCAVVLLILAVGAPGVLHQRQAARTLSCLCHMKNLSLSLQNFASSLNGQFPPLTGDFVSSPGEGDQPTERSIHLGWPVALLPALDSSKLLAWIKTYDESQLPDLKKAVAEGRSEGGAYKLFLCPNDTRDEPGNLGLSYVVNVGFMADGIFKGDPKQEHRLGGLSWNGNNITDETADVEVSAATGVIWRPSKAFLSTMDYVSQSDGLSSTLLMSENRQAGSWLDTDTTRIGFGVPVANEKQQVTFGRGSYFESVERPLNSAFAGTTLLESDEYRWRINRDPKAAMGTRPRPSSNHNGGVNATMCDGSCRFLSQKISPLVYVRLITCNGFSYGEPPLKQREF